ncbi:DNA independent RNA polymerase I transcription factor [Terramyces sp. JEL0728]|nr:DNA independent RNA polymerase I transcription factor [Terramyces sp. JEL0728]
MDSELKNVRFSLPTTEREDFPKDYDSMTKYLASVFQEKSKGNEQPYNELLHILSQSPTSARKLSKLQIKLLVQALSLFVSSMNHKMQSLVNAILQLDWIDQEQNFISMYLHLVQNVVSAQSSYVVPVTQTIVQYIRTGQKKYPNIPSSILFEQIHSALAKILRLIPTGPSFILPILSKSVPHKSEPLSSISFYVKSLLAIAEYAPVIRVQLMEIIIDLIVQMDIDIQIEDIEDELENEDVFAMDDFEAEQRRQFDDSDADSDESSQVISSDYKVMIAKLDAVMQLVTNYISNVKKLEDQSLLNETYFGLLSSFDKIMLPTHKLRSAQFLVFYTSSMVSEYPEELMGLLVTHLLNVSTSTVLRESAASYLGSFIARAKHVGVDSVKHCLRLLNQLCQTYIDSYEHELQGQLQASLR